MAQIRTLIDQSNEPAQREQLQILLRAAEGKLSVFQTEIDDMFRFPEKLGIIQVVGNRSIATYREYRANISEGVDKEINFIIDSFFKGTSGIKDGFRELIKVGLNTILGQETIGEWEQQWFTVVPDNNALVRADVKCWRWNFTSEGVISKCKNAFAFIIVKSIVDHRKLTVDELVYFLSESVGGNIEQLEKYIEQLQRLWKLLEQLTPEQVAAVYGEALPTRPAPALGAVTPSLPNGG
jgi:hypothetical protein